MNLHRRGQLDEAEKLYRRILEIQPTYHNALHFLGVLLHERGDSAEAAHLIEQSIVERPDYPDAHNNLGNVLISLGQTAEAIAAYRKAIACRPNFAEAYNNLGMALHLQGELTEAIQVLQQGIALKPDCADTYFSLGQALAASDQPDAAIEAIQEGLKRNPSQSDGYQQLGLLLYIRNRIEEAKTCYRQWAAQNPDDPEAWHLLAAFTGEEVPDRASDNYIKKTFDAFANSFDKKLEHLEYQAPQLLAAVVAAEWATPDSTLQILDAGCGTGLCGPLLRPYAHRLIGVDLSPGMVNKARAREVYDELVIAELTAFLQEQSECFDLIVTADTLIYFGVLGTFFSAAANALRPGGRLAFSVESLEDDATGLGFRLNPHGRYSHTEHYLRRELVKAGLTLRSLSKVNLRFEVQQRVLGYIALAVKLNPTESATGQPALTDPTAPESPAERAPTELTVPEALDIAIRAHQSGDLAMAESIYQGILQMVPDHTDAMQFLGMLRFQCGDADEALRLLDRMVALNPDHASAHNNRGNILNALGRQADALAAYQNSVRLDADNVDAYCNIGALMAAQGQLQEAIHMYQEAIKRNPEHAESHYHLGRALARLDRDDEAVQAYYRATASNVRHGASHKALAESLYRLQRTDEAVKAFSSALYYLGHNERGLEALREWLEFDPDNPQALFIWQSWNGETVPPRAPEDYIRTLFDRHADDFDVRLLNLEYRGPELAIAAIANHLTPTATLRILDAGCGTGLCGPLLRPFAFHLTGIDLSPRMLEKARDRGSYDELQIGELTVFMCAHPGLYNVIVFADTLNYFGDLAPPLRAAAVALAPNGLLVFTVEQLGNETGEFSLSPTGRYAHSQGYLESTIQSEGFILLSIDSAVLRLERNEPVRVHVVLASKPSNPSTTS